MSPTPPSPATMSRASRLLLLSDLMLLAVAVIWGTSYGVAKLALAHYPVLGLLALRFGLTFVLLSPALRTLPRAGRAATLRAAGAGAVLFAVFLCETFGVMLTRAANAAFLISLCVVLTPLAEWALLRRRPSRREWIAVALSMLGAWLLTADGAFALTLSFGDALILAAAVLRALFVCAMKSSMAAPCAPAPLAITALHAGMIAGGSIAVICVTALSADQTAAYWPLPANPSFWACVLYLVVACTLFAFFAQNYAIARSSPTRVALLMGSEPAFGALFAYWWLAERIAPMAWLGGALIVVASLLATVRWRAAPRAVAASNVAAGTAGAAPN